MSESFRNLFKRKYHFVYLMATQRAGDQGKPTIHLGATDTKLAKDLDIEDDSPSTVYTDSLRIRKRYVRIKRMDVKEARKQIIEICNEIKDRYDVDRVDLIGDLV